METKVETTIVNRWTNETIFVGTGSLLDVLQAAIKAGADLEGANLRNATLADANLCGARLEGANLCGARLEGANLEGANLRNAKLGGAKLEGANLEGANLRNAKLEGANLGGVYLTGADMRRADMRRANLEGAKLEGVYLTGAYLTGANLEGAIGLPKTPIVKNLDQKMLTAVSVEGALDMQNWHTCETTHCRAGWAVTLAGEAGKELEKATSTAIAAQLIYLASTGRKNCPDFYATNDVAMADIRKCAEEATKEG